MKTIFSLTKSIVMVLLIVGQLFLTAKAENKVLPTLNTASPQLRSVTTSNADHDKNKTLDLEKLRLSTYPVLSLIRPLKLEVSYDEPISLPEALHYVMRNSLPIKISWESAIYQKYQLLGQMAGFLPSFSLAWNLSRAEINNRTSANSRVFQTIVRYPVFQGGGVVYGALNQYYRDVAWHRAYDTTVNDTLLDVYNKYTNLVLNQSLLHIAAKSVEVSQAQLALNNSLYQSGVGTKFAIMQSRTQLSQDRQTLLQQRINTRMAALNLAFALNLPMTVNLVPYDENITEQSLIDRNTNIEELLDIALKNRPELRLYEYFDLTAARLVQLVAAPLYPQVSFFTGYTLSSTTVNPTTSAGDLNGVASASVTASTNGIGTVSNTALGQSAFFSPTGSSTGNTGANTRATNIVASSGGNPISTVQSGSLVTSGAVAPSFNNASGLNTLGGAVNLAGGNTAGAGIFAGKNSTLQAGFNLTWALPNFGAESVANIVALRALSREALVQANQQLILVAQQVRQDYLSAAVAREQIDTAAYGTESAAEALRIAELRVKAGAGTNLELIQAQRDYINALTTQAQAIIASNQAQAQLLHDTGAISVETLINGYSNK
jgi:outer membrane protein TolC